uniref:Uncharacterized protein n=1 Tax=Guillardia theta TaxID=55529 RepID=A0A7S4PRC6_GUITH|mmetsp:Transcript_945/g.2992  ORF Transcript_945/g.2992 Transcript_945/m.2992 type:complete len:353 (+) Transcript_945:621-1679(+)
MPWEEEEEEEEGGRAGLTQSILVFPWRRYPSSPLSVLLFAGSMAIQVRASSPIMSMASRSLVPRREEEEEDDQGQASMEESEAPQVMDEREEQSEGLLRDRNHHLDFSGKMRHQPASLTRMDLSSLEMALKGRESFTPSQTFWKTAQRDHLPQADNESPRGKHREEPNEVEGCKKLGSGLWSFRTKPKTANSSNKALLFGMKAKQKLRITGLRTSSNLGAQNSEEREYQVWLTSDGLSSQTRWNEVGRGHTRLPREAGAYGELPLGEEGVELEAGQTCLFFLCCPSSAGGIAFRRDVYSLQFGETSDKSKHLDLLAGCACSLSDVADMSELAAMAQKSPARAFAGEIEYELL